jgi:hypothetical protein
MQQEFTVQTALLLGQERLFGVPLRVQKDDGMEA